MYSAPLNLHQPPADVVVAARTASTTLLIGMLYACELVRIDVHLVLPHESAQRRHFRHARDRLAVGIAGTSPDS